MTPAALRCGGDFCDPPEGGFFRAGFFVRVFVPVLAPDTNEGEFG
jgi:hypothetical protein